MILSQVNLVFFKYRNLLLCKVIAINNLPINDVISKFSNISTKTNDAIIKNNFIAHSSYKAIYEYYGIVNSDSMKVTYQDDKGNHENLYIKNISVSNYKDINWMGVGSNKNALCDRNRKKMFWYDYNESEKVLYAQYNTLLY